MNTYTQQERTLTPELKKRIYQSITETINYLQKENSISEDLRHHDKVAKYELHLNNLYKMLELGYWF